MRGPSPSLRSPWMEEIMSDERWYHCEDKTDEFLLKSKCVRCWEVWGDVEMGVLEESHFEKERDALFRVLLRMIEKNPERNHWLASMPELMKVARHKTKAYLDADAERKELCAAADAETDVSKKIAILEKAERCWKLVTRPSSLYTIVQTKSGARMELK